ncbi:hypothetical protein [Moorella sp. Hama-1]|uniref:hypothetical protein n=1 Tax=Moorella sp. Hama-1 TaxID=2138101 RepID=UPI0013799CB7|nr:hypothetical protein [Moorella sp. Hama-1]BCV21886.1 hypothetical protein hamaS1_19550 [Moorella sp. Hama-1]
MALGFWRGFLAGGVVGAIVGSISRYRAEPAEPVVNSPAEVRVPVRPRGVIRRRHP